MVLGYLKNNDTRFVAFSLLAISQDWENNIVEFHTLEVCKYQDEYFLGHPCKKMCKFFCIITKFFALLWNLKRRRNLLFQCRLRHYPYHKNKQNSYVELLFSTQLHTPHRTGFHLNQPFSLFFRYSRGQGLGGFVTKLCLENMTNNDA